MALTYLHYYYGNSNSPFTSADFFENKRKNLLDMQLKAFEQQKKELVNQISKVPDDYAKVLELLTDTSKSDERTKIYQASMNQQNAVPDKILFQTAFGEELSAGNIQNLKGNIEAKVGDITTSINNFNISLTQTLEQAYNNLYGNNNFKEYQASIIAEYIQGSQINFNSDESKLKQDILTNFLHHQGFIKNSMFSKKDSSRIKDSLNKLILLAYALPDYSKYTGTYSGKNTQGEKTIDNLPQFFQIIAGKVQGLYNMVKGDGAELTGMIGEKACIDAAGKGLNDLNKLFTITNTGNSISNGGVSVLSTFKPDSAFSTAFDFNNSAQISGTYSKPDITVSYNQNGVKIQYGLTVKNYQLQNSKNGLDSYFINAKLSDSTSLYHALSSIFSGTGMYGVFQLAGGHGNGNVKLLNGQRYTNNQLDEMWNSLKDLAVTGNLLSYLGGIKEDNTLFMIANGRVIGLDQILRDIINNKTKETYHIKGAHARSNFTKINKWVDTEANDHQNAIKRSNEAIPKIASLLQEAKITTHLKIFFS